MPCCGVIKIGRTRKETLIAEDISVILPRKILQRLRPVSPPFSLDERWNRIDVLQAKSESRFVSKFREHRLILGHALDAGQIRPRLDAAAAKETYRNGDMIRIVTETDEDLPRKEAEMEIEKQKKRRRYKALPVPHVIFLTPDDVVAVVEVVMAPSRRRAVASLRERHILFYCFVFGSSSRER